VAVHDARVVSRAASRYNYAIPVAMRNVTPLTLLPSDALLQVKSEMKPVTKPVRGKIVLKF
jgi:hypothetical protein